MKKKSIIYTLIVLIIACLGFLGFLVYSNNKQINVEPEMEEETVTVDEYAKEKAVYQANKEINPDYVGDIYFTSGLINDSFVQATSVYDSDGNLYTFYNQDGSLVTDPEGYNGNDVYIWTYWKTGEYDYNDHGGSVFMDYRNSLSDQNIIIYGHHFSTWNDETRTKAFTPLEKLLEEENYQENKEINLLLENEIRTYELWAVYEFDATDSTDMEKAQFYRISYNYDDYAGTSDENYYQNYIDYVNEKKLYPTDINLTVDDKTLTLQTCISGHTGELFEICVFKLVNTTTFD